VATWFNIVFLGCQPRQMILIDTTFQGLTPSPSQTWMLLSQTLMESWKMSRGHNTSGVLSDSVPTHKYFQCILNAITVCLMCMMTVMFGSLTISLPLLISHRYLANVRISYFLYFSHNSWDPVCVSDSSRVILPTLCTHLTRGKILDSQLFLLPHFYPQKKDSFSPIILKIHTNVNMFDCISVIFLQY
jgi:hypothetical protein